METETLRGLPDSVKLGHEAHNHSITPLFKHLAPLNVALSEEAGRPIYSELMEVVELRLAGDRNYSPVVPADAMSHKVGNRVITYAERFQDQYLQFVAGEDQMSGGTALEQLYDYGITPAQLSICRALKVYSIEALHSMGPNELKNLGLSANPLRKMASQFMADRDKRAIASTNENVDVLRAEIERLKTLIPVQETPVAEIDKLVAVADTEFEQMNDDELKDYIASMAGARPRGNPNRSTLINMAEELATS